MQIQRWRLTESSLTQLPNEYMPYAGVVRKIYRCRRKSFFWKREVGICRFEVAGAKTQVEINFLQTPATLIVSNFSLRAAGQHGLMSTKRNPFARNADRHAWRSNCNVGLSWASPFPRNASRPSKAVVKL